MSNPTISDMLVGLEFKPVEDIPTIMFTKVGVDEYDISDDAYSTLRSRMSVGQVYDFVFASDEVFDIRVYAYEGVPFVMYERIGDVDEGTLAVFNRSVWIKFMSDVHTLVCDVVSPDEYTVSRNSYIVFGKERTFSVASPGWLYGFRDDLFTKYHATYEGKSVEFIRFADKRSGWSDRNRVVLKIDGVDVTVDGRDIVFQERN